MATIALTVAGAAAGNAIFPGVGMLITGSMIGAAIGGTVGGVIDSQFVMPALFGAANAGNGPRLDELQLQTASEGSPINRCLGAECPAVGTVIWMPQMREEEASSGGGKGGLGGGGSSSGFSYFGDLSILVCRGPISRIRKIWASGRLIYNGATAPSGLTITSNQLSIDAPDVILPGVIQYQRRRVSVISPVGGPDLTQIAVNRDVTISGALNSGNNGTYRVVRTVDNGVSGTELVLQWRAGTIDEIAGSTITITQSAESSDGSLFESVNFQLGTLSQMPNAAYEAAVGTDNAVAFRSWAVVTFINFAYSEFGNTLPQFRFLVEENASRTVGEAIAMIFEDAGLTPDEYDVSDVTMPLRGYTFQGPTTLAQALEPLLLGYDLSVRESNNKLIVYRRAAATLIPVDVDDLAARDGSSTAADVPRPMQIDELDEDKLPVEINVDHFDPDFEWQKSSQPYRKVIYTSPSSSSLALPLVLEGDDVRSIGKRLVLTAWAERKKAMLSLPPSYQHVEEGDLLGPISVAGQSYVVRVDEMTVGLNRRLDIQGTITDLSLFDSVISTQGPTTTETTTYYPPPLAMFVLDIPSLRSADAEQPTVYLGTFALNPDAAFRGASYYWSIDDANFNLIETTANELTGGECVSVLGSASSLYWDIENYVDVELSHGELETRTDLDVLNGHNIALIGNEIVGFVNAVLIAPRTYRVSRLLRGLRNTEGFTVSHEPGESFLLLTDALTTQRVNFATLGTERYWRSVPVGGAIADSPSNSGVLEGQSVKSFAPCHFTATRSGTNDISLAWTRRSRVLHRHFSGSVPAMLEESEKYEVVITDGTFTVSIFVLGGTSTVYSASQQAADGLTVGDPLQVKVYQVSDLYGRGFPSEELTV